MDILVNNAGAMPGGSINRVDEATWRQAWDLKVFGYINMCRLAYDRMRDAGHGVIINVIGAAGERPSPGYIYCRCWRQCIFDGDYTRSWWAQLK